MSTTSFYASSADILARFYENRDDLAALLDPETGFAPSLSQMCRKKYAIEVCYTARVVTNTANVRLDDALNSSTIYEESAETLELLRLESNTWDLLQSLMS